MSELGSVSVSERLMPVAEAFEVATGQRISVTSAWRYTTTGRNGHRLKSWLVGQRRLTTPTEVRSFCEKIAEIQETTAK